MHPKVTDQIKWISIRIIATLVVMVIVSYLMRKINYKTVMFVNLSITYALELLDSIPMQAKYQREWTQTYTYKLFDKIGDMLLYLAALVLGYIGNKGGDTFLYLYTGAYVYRFIGVILFVFTKKDIWLVICPNFINIIYIYLILTELLHLNRKLIDKFIFLLIPLTFLYEYLHHMVFSKTDPKYDILEPLLDIF